MTTIQSLRLFVGTINRTHSAFRIFSASRRKNFIPCSATIFTIISDKILISPYLFINFYFMNLYIGNLNYNVREGDLRGVMEEYGTVASVKLITDRISIAIFS